MSDTTATPDSKPLLSSKTPPVVLASALLTWGAARYGLALDPDTAATLVAAAVTLASYAMRAITSRPISGLVK